MCILIFRRTAFSSMECIYTFQFLSVAVPVAGPMSGWASGSRRRTGEEMEKTSPIRGFLVDNARDVRHNGHAAREWTRPGTGETLMEILSCGGCRGHVDFTGHGFSGVDSFIINTAAERHYGHADANARYVFATLAIAMNDITEDALLAAAEAELA